MGSKVAESFRLLLHTTGLALQGKEPHPDCSDGMPGTMESWCHPVLALGDARCLQGAGGLQKLTDMLRVLQPDGGCSGRGG